jgi:hypothetical protein
LKALIQEPDEVELRLLVLHKAVFTRIALDIMVTRAIVNSLDHLTETSCISAVIVKELLSSYSNAALARWTPS